MDRGDREKELVAVLLSALHPQMIPPHEVDTGYQLVLDSMEQLVVDVPDAVDVVSKCVPSCCAFDADSVDLWLGLVLRACTRFGTGPTRLLGCQVYGEGCPGEYRRGGLR